LARARRPPPCTCGTPGRGSPVAWPWWRGHGGGWLPGSEPGRRPCRRAAPRGSARRGRRRPGASRWRLGRRRARAAPRSHLSLLLLPGFRRRSGGGQAVDGEVADPLGRGQGGDGGQWGEAPVVQGADGLLAGRPGGEGDVPPGGDVVAGVGVGDPGALVHRAVPFSPGSLWCVLSCALVLRT